MVNIQLSWPDLSFIQFKSSLIPPWCEPSWVGESSSFLHLGSLTVGLSLVGLNSSMKPHTFQPKTPQTFKIMQSLHAAHTLQRWYSPPGISSILFSGWFSYHMFLAESIWGVEWKSVDNGSDIGGSQETGSPHSRECEGVLLQPPTSASILSPSKH